MNPKQPQIPAKCLNCLRSLRKHGQQKWKREMLPPTNPKQPKQRRTQPKRSLEHAVSCNGGFAVLSRFRSFSDSPRNRTEPNWTESFLPLYNYYINLSSHVHIQVCTVDTCSHTQEIYGSRCWSPSFRRRFEGGRPSLQSFIISLHLATAISIYTPGIQHDTTPQHSTTIKHLLYLGT